MRTLEAVPVESKAVIWTGRVISILVTLFMLMDGVMKLLQPPQVLQATVELGYPRHLVAAMGVMVLVCAVLYAIPQTAVLGAILLTGFLGGAFASNFRVEGNLFSMAFPVLFGVLVWLGVYLRDRRLRDLLPMRTRS